MLCKGNMTLQGGNQKNEEGNRGKEQALPRPERAAQLAQKLDEDLTRVIAPP
jgi:hypothetical protein